MKFHKRTIFVILVLGLLSLITTGPPARADIILGFPNGLTGWSTAGDDGTVTESGGQATIAESLFAPETDLFLSFTVPTGAQSLQFTLVSLSADSTLADIIANGYLPDAFGASLLNPSTGKSLVPTVNAKTDSYYIRDVVDGVTQGETAMGVTESSLLGALALISVDLSSLGLDGQTAEILFRLSGGTDPSSSSSVTISDVKVIANSGPAVPEPGSFTLACLAILCSIGYGRRLLRHPGLMTRTNLVATLHPRWRFAACSGRGGSPPCSPQSPHHASRERIRSEL